MYEHNLPDKEQYLVLHRILKALRFAGVSYTQRDTGGKGHIPLYHYSTNSSTLTFGTLADLFYHPEKYKPEKLDGTFLSSKTTTSEQVDISREKWEIFSIAVDVLSLAGDIDVKLDKDEEGHVLEKKVSITKEGVKKLHTQFYLREQERVNKEDKIYESTIRTNSLVRSTNKIVALFTVVLTLGAFAPFLLLTKDGIENMKLNESKRDEAIVVNLNWDSTYNPKSLKIDSSGKARR
jgi:hypothetical protein